MSSSSLSSEDGSTNEDSSSITTFEQQCIKDIEVLLSPYNKSFEHLLDLLEINSFNELYNWSKRDSSILNFLMFACSFITVKANIAHNLSNDIYKVLRTPDPTLTKDSLRDQFTGPFVGDSALQFEQHIDHCFTSVSSILLYNYTTVIQSSGFGKTRTVTTFGQSTEKYYVLYWCLRSIDVDGFPPGNQPIYSFFRSLNNQDAEKSLRSLLSNVIALAEKSPSPADFWRDYSAPMIIQPNDLTKECNTKWTTFISSVQSDVPNHNHATTIKNQSNKKVVLIIDEARSLIEESQLEISQFRFLRRVSIEFESLRIVLIDTVSRISNFARPLRLDHSSRETRVHVRYPYIAISQFDLWKKYDDNTTSTSTSTTTSTSTSISSSSTSSTSTDIVQQQQQQLFDLTWLFSLGRPLWRTKITAEGVESCIGFATQKLLKQDPSDSIDTPLSTEQAIALLAVRVNTIIPIAYLASNLVAYHLATCIGISNDREYVHAQYLSEPLLAEAATRHLYSTNILKQCLKKYREAIESGVVENSTESNVNGILGERIFPLLACLVKDQLVVESDCFKESSIYTQEIPLQNWLKLFLPTDKEDPNQWSQVCHQALHSANFSNAMIYFTHWTKLYDSSYCIDQEKLKLLYHRACAVILATNQRGIEYVIPCRFNTTSSNQQQQQQQQESQYGAVLLQLKTYSKKSKDPLYPDSVSYKLCAQYVFNNQQVDNSKYLGLYLMQRVVAVPDTNIQRKVQYWSNEQYDIHINKFIWKKIKSLLQLQSQLVSKYSELLNNHSDKVVSEVSKLNDEITELQTTTNQVLDQLNSNLTTAQGTLETVLSKLKTVQLLLDHKLSTSTSSSSSSSRSIVNTLQQNSKTQTESGLVDQYLESKYKFEVSLKLFTARQTTHQPFDKYHSLAILELGDCWQHLNLPSEIKQLFTELLQATKSPLNSIPDQSQQTIIKENLTPWVKLCNDPDQRTTTPITTTSNTTTTTPITTTSNTTTTTPITTTSNNTTTTPITTTSNTTTTTPKTTTSHKTTGTKRPADSEAERASKRPRKTPKK